MCNLAFFKWQEKNIIPEISITMEMQNNCVKLFRFKWGATRFRNDEKKVETDHAETLNARKYVFS